MSLIINDLCFAYTAKKTCLENICLEIPLGSIYGLLGPNGAGKSTLLNILSGLLPLQAGSISVNGCAVGSLSEALPISLVPQDLAFYPNLTALENLQFFAAVQGIRGSLMEERIAQAVKAVALQAYLQQRAATFSGGLKRRLNLAIGLLNAPKILLLDEPTVGIDAQTRNFLLDCIKQLAKQGVCIIYTSHYMEEIESICDSVAIIDHGKIQLQGQVSQLLLDHQQACHIYLASSLPDALLELLFEKYSSEEIEYQVNVLSVLQPEKIALTQLFSLLDDYGVNISAIDYANAKRLETLYLNLTQRELRD